MTAGIIQTATWPGIELVRSAHYTRGLGIFPGVAVVEITPQAANFAVDGTLTFWFDGQAVKSFAGRVDYATLRFTGRGQVVQVHILDRRWKWKFGQTFGRYNIRFDDGTIDPRFEKSPQQLAARLLDAMAETNYDVSDLPGFDRPEVNWDGDNPAIELSKLCRSRGCDISIDGPHESVRIVRLGVGADLPNNDEIRTVEFGVDATEAPSHIKAYGQRAVFQSKLRLRAIFADASGNMGGIDQHNQDSAALSAQDATFGRITSPKEFSNIADQADREAVEKTYFRWYIVDQVVGTWSLSAINPIDGTIQNYGVQSMWQILPIHDWLIDTYLDVDGIARRRRAFVEGVFVAETDPIAPGLGANSGFGTPVPLDFSIDGDRGIVKFTEPVYRYDQFDNFLPARLWLVATYHIKNPVQGNFARVDQLRALGGPLTPPETIVRDDVPAHAKMLYDDSEDTLLVTGTEDNLALARQELDRHIDARILSYQTVRSYAAEYRGVIGLLTDGAIRQVTWRVGMHGGATTLASYNNEFQTGVLRGPARRALELDRQIEQTESRSQNERARRDDGK